MFDWFGKKRRAQAGGDLHELLFGDVPLHAWAGDGVGEPWSSFRGAAAFLEEGDAEGARRELERVVARPGLESRHYLQAWQILRSLGAGPPAEQADHLYGVVVEVGLPQGLDTLATYEDGRSRYLNQSGAAVIWERPDDSLDELSRAVLSAGKSVVAQTGVWQEARPAPPSRGQARVSFLTPGGLHFGQAPFDTLARDPLAGPVLAAATMLMRGLTEKAARGTAG